MMMIMMMIYNFLNLGEIIAYTTFRKYGFLYLIFFIIQNIWFNDASAHLSILCYEQHRSNGPCHNFLKPTFIYPKYTPTSAKNGLL